MRLRRPNRSQKWFCSDCKQFTTHSIPDLDSDWDSVDGIRIYQRWRRCKKCGRNLRTAELKRTELDRVFAEVDQLRSTKRDFERLLAALKSKNDAERVIAQFLPEDGKT